jgi:hypothetical protein
MISRHALGAALLLAASIGPARANRDLFVVDLVNNPAPLEAMVAGQVKVRGNKRRTRQAKVEG